MRANNRATLIAQTTNTPQHTPSMVKEYLDIGVPMLISGLVIWFGYAFAKQWLASQSKNKTDVMELLIQSFKEKSKDQADAIDLLASNLKSIASNDGAVLQLLTTLSKNMETTETTLNVVITTVGSTTRQLQVIEDTVRALHRRIDATKGKEEEHQGYR